MYKQIMTGAVGLMLLAGSAAGSDGTHAVPVDAVAAQRAYLARVQAAGAFPDTLEHAAWLTHAAYYRAVSAGEVKPSTHIPPLYWADRIRALEPLRIYTHRVNLVVVQEQSGQVEKGLYIHIPISSYLPESGDDGFAFTTDPMSSEGQPAPECLQYLRMVDESEPPQAGKETVFMGVTLPSALYRGDGYAVRDLYIEDVPGTKSFWLGPWVETVAVNGIPRFYLIKGYDRYYVNAAHPEYSAAQFMSLSSGRELFYGPFEGKPADRFDLR